MELGIGNDDDLFCEGKNKPLKEQGGWNAKQCEVEWFMEDVLQDAGSHSSEDAQLISYQADLLYNKRQFAQALVAYKSGLQMLASRFVLLRRILIEGASRCCMYLQDHEQSLYYAQMLLEESLTLEHRMIAHSLLASVHTAAGNQLGAIKSLHLCVQWQRSNVQFWLKLADAYSALYNQSNHVAHIGQARSGLINGICTDGLSDSNPSLIHHRDGSVTKSAETRNSSDKAQSSLKQSEVSLEDNLQNDPQNSDVDNVCNIQPMRTNGGELEHCGMKGCTEDGACGQGTIVETSTHVDCSRSDGDHCAEYSGVRDNSSSVSDLLNAFDRLAMVADAKSSCEAVVGTLLCRDCQPLLYAASCLLRARLLLKSVEHSVNSFAKDKNSRLQKQVDEHLAILNLDHALLEVLHLHTRQIFRKGYRKLDGDASGDVKEEEDVTDESNLSSEFFEKRWFQWDIS